MFTTKKKIESTILLKTKQNITCNVSVQCYSKSRTMAPFKKINKTKHKKKKEMCIPDHEQSVEMF